jgi:TonB-linked SusC/RagA family outer membrane protein
MNFFCHRQNIAARESIPSSPIVFKIMKLVILLIVVFQIGVLANGKAQQVNISVKNAQLKEVFAELSKQTKYRFFYNEESIQNVAPLTFQLKNVDIRTALNKALERANLTFNVHGKTITIVNKEAADKTIRKVNIEVRGSVKDSANMETLPGVSIFVKGKPSFGTTTDGNGKYKLSVPDGSTLVFTFVGYIKKEILISGRNVIDVVLSPDNSTLNEVTVVAFGKQKKESVVSSISTVSGETLQFGGRNLSNNLQGQVAGIISFQRSGEPGYDNSTFWIRGISTYNGAQNPLILVDGVPRSFNDIDPNEIATFSVLKDAAATSVYGAEGANGVILVTTKRGRVQKTEITYRGEYSTLSPLRMPEFVGSAEYLTIYNEALANEGKAPIFNAALIDKYKSGVDRELYPDNYWLKTLLRDDTYNTRHNISFRGGTEKAKYFVSGAFYKENGLFKNNALAQYSSNIGLKRYNLRSNIDLDVSPTTVLRVDISGQYLETNYPGVGTSTIFNLATTAPPYLYPAVYSDGKLADHPRTSTNRSNPYNNLNNSGYTNEFRTNIQTKVDLDQKLEVLTKGLSAKLSASYDYYGTYVTPNGKSINSFYANGRDIKGNLIYTQIKSGTDQILPGATTLNSTKNIYIEGSLNYHRTFSEKHDVTAMALAYEKESQITQAGQGAIDRLPFRKLAYVGRTTYSFDRRYSIDANVGISGSETFADGHRYGVFPAIGVAWNASNEKFYPEGLKKIVSSIKLRASYGLTGNDQYIVNSVAQRFLYRGGFVTTTGATLGYNSGAALGVNGGYTEDKFSAPGLSWETEKKKNFGADLGFFDNKVNFVFDYFDNYRYDILVQRATVSSAAGFNQSPFQNFGKVTNKGFETSLTYQHRIGLNSVLGLRGNFTYAHNKVLELDEIPQLYPWMSSTGNSLNFNNVFMADRLFEDGDFNITTNADGSKNYALKTDIANQIFFGAVLPGDIKYKDLNADGIINQFDQTKYEGNPATPEINYGFGVSYAFKGLSLSLFFTGVASTTTILGASNPSGFFPFAFGVDESSVRATVRDRWTSGNPSQDVLYPRIRTSANANNQAASTWWARDAGFLRLKTAELGYSLPKKWMERAKISNAKLYMQGYNLLTWDNIKYWDPEQGNLNSGVTYPQSRSFTFGLELSL